MLGNDIVDLNDAETREGARHERFDGRVFSAAERDAIAASPRPAQTRWMLWAAKEAAYKAARRIDPHTVFSPPRFRVTLDRDGAGTVRHDDRPFDVRVETVGPCVHALAGADLPADTLHGLARLDAGDARDPGAAVRTLSIRMIARRLGVVRSALRIQRIARIPQLVVDGERLDCALSLSHHGDFIGFACRIKSATGAAA
jgi:phosphopantetheinyl transferase (holo-ACP synthase)